MTKLRLLVVEDDERVLRTLRDSIRVFERKNEVEIESVECGTVCDASKKIDSSFDGAIIDLKLADQDDGGQQVIAEIKQSFFRIPIAIFTGFPSDWHGNQIRVYVKGRDTHEEILTRFQNIYSTGLTRIMGGRGSFEEHLNRVFTDNLMPEIDKWIDYGLHESDKTERALLRYTLNHLSYFLDDDSENCYPEEFYLRLQHTESDSLSTGRIVNSRNECRPFVVMNPACDLVVENNGNLRTDRILIVSIDSGTELFSWFNDQNLSRTRQGELRKALQNNSKSFHHWLPETEFFEGGFLNFRKLSAFSLSEFRSQFEVSQIQISPTFVKDIVSRFSSYYARQGQPGIELEGFINRGEISADGNSQ